MQRWMDFIIWDIYTCVSFYVLDPNSSYHHNIITYQQFYDLQNNKYLEGFGMQTADKLQTKKNYKDETIYDWGCNFSRMYWSTVVMQSHLLPWIPSCLISLPQHVLMALCGSLIVVCWAQGLPVINPCHVCHKNLKSCFASYHQILYKVGWLLRSCHFVILFGIISRAKF